MANCSCTQHCCIESGITPALYSALIGLGQAIDSQSCSQQYSVFTEHINNNDIHISADERQLLSQIIGNSASYVLSSELDAYYTKSEIDNKHFLTSIPSYYITEEEIKPELQALDTAIDDLGEINDQTQLKLDELNDIIEELRARITALENKQSDDSNLLPERP